VVLCPEARTQARIVTGQQRKHSQILTFSSPRRNTLVRAHNRLALLQCRFKESCRWRLCSHEDVWWFDRVIQMLSLQHALNSAHLPCPNKEVSPLRHPLACLNIVLRLQGSLLPLATLAVISLSASLIQQLPAMPLLLHVSFLRQSPESW
jgi:hypothetical protein